MIPTKFTRKLKKLLGHENVLTDENELVAYSYDSQPQQALPDAMVLVSSTNDIAGTVKLAVEYGIPIVARGAGSGMTGGAIPERGGIIVNMERMDRIIDISVEDRIAYLQPGVITGDFQAVVSEKGLYYPPEPASSQYSSIGGNVAESAGGLGCVKYGLTKHFVAGLIFVTTGGDVVKTGVYSDKDSPFDVGALMLGSEGTLAVITEVAVRLIDLPESRVTVLALFRSLVETAQASNAVLMSGVNPSVLEFMDRRCIDTVREYAEVSIPDDTGALLIAELDGDTTETETGHKILLETLQNLHPLDLKSARTEKERNALWKLRKSLSPAIVKIAPLKFNEDICVPLSRIPEMAAFVEELGKRHDVQVVTFGHSGDGNLHVNFMTHWKRPDEIARAKTAIEELFRETVRVGGTLSGEHGIGIAKRPYLSIELDEATMEFEKRIKHAFDPGNILNPGKIFPE
ncbi:MAG: FAD-binding protein [Candidatus Latescibacteria bacterium]|nr:FAD-binding protein [Candidatus Latescibacterota bacterium]